MPFRLFPALALAALVAVLCRAPQALASPLQDDQQEGEVEEAFTQTRGITFGTRPSAAKPATKPAAKPVPPPKKPSTSAKPKGGGNETASGGGKKPKGGAGAGSTGGADGGAGAGGGRPDNVKGTGGGTEAKRKPGDEDAGATPPPGGGEAALAGDASAIGLGYTLFMNDPEGNPVVVDPAKAFKAGDKIRVMLEPNTDGYLYIFHAENDRDPQMLYPNVALDEGRNQIGAHARDFVPANLRDAFVFDEVPAIERLYIVLSREPLEGVPTGAQLFEYCGDRRVDCNWTPTPALWESIKSHPRGVESRAKTKILLAKNTLSRGLKVRREEPPPAVIRMAASTTDGVLVTTVDLVHK